MSDLPPFAEPGAARLLDRVRAVAFPGGEPRARRIVAFVMTERGEMRSSPSAAWQSFTSEQRTETGRSAFRWDARLRGVLVTDAFEQGHGRLTVKALGFLRLKTNEGPDFDTGELQRYLASLVFAPAGVLNNAALTWASVGPDALRVCDRHLSWATVDLHVDADGRLASVSADRPMLAGRQSVLTPWSATCADFRERDGLLIPHHLEVSWHLASGPFLYYRSEIRGLTLEIADC